MLVVCSDTRGVVDIGSLQAIPLERLVLVRGIIHHIHDTMTNVISIESYRGAAYLTLTARAGSGEPVPPTIAYCDPI